MRNRNRLLMPLFLLCSSFAVLGVLHMLGCTGAFMSYYVALSLVSGAASAAIIYRPAMLALRWRVLRLTVRLRRSTALALRTARVRAVESVADPVFLLRSAVLLALGFVFLEYATVVLDAAGGPWGTAAKAVCTAFTGVIGKGLALTAFVVGGLMFAFGEGGSKSALAGLIFGAGMVLSAPAFLTWVGITGVAC